MNSTCWMVPVQECRAALFLNRIDATNPNLYFSILLRLTLGVSHTCRASNFRGFCSDFPMIFYAGQQLY